jgi:hypothetical protein
MEHSIVCGYPQGPVAVFGQTSYHPVAQAFGGAEVREFRISKPDQTSALGSDPQSAIGGGEQSDDAVLYKRRY